MYDAVNASRGLWTRLLYQIMNEACIAPGSLSLVAMQVAEIKRSATRPSRLEHILTRREINNHTEPLLRLRKFRKLSLSFGAGDRGAWRPIIRLLPGGRWIVGLSSVETELILCCWDLHSAVDTWGVLYPVASISGTENVDLIPDVLLDLQYDPTEDCVTLLITYSPLADGHDQCEVIQLFYHPSGPTRFQRRAVFPRLNFTDFNFYYTRLHGDFVCLQSRELICVWNWKENTRGILSEHNHAPVSTPLIIGRSVFLPIEKESSNVYRVQHVELLPSCDADPMERAQVNEIGTVRFNSVADHRAGAVLRPQNGWLPPTPDRTLYAVWSVDGINSRALEITKSTHLSTIARYDHLGFVRETFQLRDGCFLEFGHEGPKRTEDYSLSLGLLVSASPSWYTQPFRILCDGNHRLPIVGLCPVSGVFLSAADYASNERTEYKMKCTVSYFE